MAKYTIEDITLTNIADAIRTKGNTTDTLTPEQMPNAIDAIEVGSGETAASNFLTHSGTYKPDYATPYKTARKNYYSTGNLYYDYVWYRESNTNVYWNIARWNNSNFEAGHEYRVSYWIWHNGDINNEPIAFHQDNIFINASISVTNPITEIRREPQLVTFTLKYVLDSNYHFGLWMYPVDSGNQIRMTVPVIEDLTSPVTTYAEVPV